MPHEAVISTIVAAIGLAFLFGAIANHIRLPAIVGYLLAGVVLGPFTPGIVADQNVARQLAEVGVILLLFGVGLHFSWQDLLSVRGVAIPGAIAQTAIVTLLGLALAWAMRSPCLQSFTPSANRSRARQVLGASLSQIGEFSFILAGLGATLKLLPENGRDLILAGAMLSILINPLVQLSVRRIGVGPQAPVKPIARGDKFPTHLLEDCAAMRC